MEIMLQVNGVKRNILIETDEMLLETLRNLGFYSVRCGCDTTNCGLCTVWVDGDPILSCAYPTFRAVGHEITTLEGVAEEAAELADCLAEEGADQCGRKYPNATDEEIKAYLNNNLCRCTGYESHMRGIRKFLGGKTL